MNLEPRAVELVFKGEGGGDFFQGVRNRLGALGEHGLERASHLKRKLF